MCNVTKSSSLKKAMLFPISVIREGCEDDYIGYIDELGVEVVPPQYRFGTHFSEGLAAVRTEDRRTEFILLDGSVSIKGDFDGVGYFREGLCSMTPRGELLGGYINRSGAWEVKPRFALKGDFSGGLAAASYGGTFGFLWKDGSYAVRPRFDQVRPFREGLAAVFDGQRWGFIDSKGVSVISGDFTGLKAGPFSEGMASVKVDGCWGLLRRDGSWAIRPKFEELAKVSEGLVAGCTSKGWSYFDAAGKQAICEWFDGCSDFVSGVAAVKKEGKWGLIDSLGRVIVKPNFNDVHRCTSNLFLVTSGSRYSYMNADGRVIWTSEEYAMPQLPRYEA